MKKAFFMILFIFAVIMLSGAQSPTPVPTIIGNLTWTRNITVLAAAGDVIFPVKDAIVTATGVTTATAVTDTGGKCTVVVTAHDTGSVTINVKAGSYPEYTKAYPGLPASDTINIYLVEPSNAGYVRLLPRAQTVYTGSRFTTRLYVDTGTQKLAAYGITLSWNPLDLISIDTSNGTNGVESGLPDFVLTVSTNNPGQLVMSGFSAAGAGPGKDLCIATIYWQAGNSIGTAQIGVAVDTLVDETYNNIGSYNPVGASVTVVMVITGDVNRDTLVNIVDALMIAQYAVGINVTGFYPAAGDVNSDGNINIIDALMVAQYAVGLITQF